MISGITATQPHNIAAQRAEAPEKRPQREKPPASKAAPPIEDSVHISNTALAALQAKPAEATETYAQIIKEALTGDLKALAKLAKSKHSGARSIPGVAKPCRVDCTIRTEVATRART